MNFSIRKNHINAIRLFENDIQAGVPTFAELEFWARIQELETCLKYYADSENWNYHNGPFDANGINFEGPEKAIEALKTLTLSFTQGTTK